jgi:hypothetical protein
MLVSAAAAFSQDTSNDIATAIRSGKATEVSKFFASSVNLIVLDKEDVYSKAQSELILKDFYSKHTPKSFTIVHNGVSKNGDKFAIGKLETSNGKFRVYFLLKKEGDKSVIQQFRIEPEDG